MPRIEQWVYCTHPDDMYLAPECRKPILNGVVYGHPLHKDGHIITTSSVHHKNEKDQVVTSSGSAYDLGEPRADYEAMFPGSKERLLKMLPLIHS